MLDSKSRFLFLFLVFAIVTSIAWTYWKTVVQRDFVIINDIEEESVTSDDTGSSE